MILADGSDMSNHMVCSLISSFFLTCAISSYDVQICSLWIPTHWQVPNLQPWIKWLKCSQKSNPKINKESFFKWFVWIYFKHQPGIILENFFSLVLFRTQNLAHNIICILSVSRAGFKFISVNSTFIEDIEQYTGNNASFSD